MPCDLFRALFPAMSAAFQRPGVPLACRRTTPGPSSASRHGLAGAPLARPPRRTSRPTYAQSAPEARLVVAAGCCGMVLDVDQQFVQAPAASLRCCRLQVAHAAFQLWIIFIVAPLERCQSLGQVALLANTMRRSGPGPRSRERSVPGAPAARVARLGRTTSFPLGQFPSASIA